MAIPNVRISQQLISLNYTFWKLQILKIIYKTKDSKKNSLKNLARSLPIIIDLCKANHQVQQIDWSFVVRAKLFIYPINKMPNWVITIN